MPLSVSTGSMKNAERWCSNIYQQKTRSTLWLLSTVSASICGRMTLSKKLKLSSGLILGIRRLEKKPCRISRTMRTGEVKLSWSAQSRKNKMMKMCRLHRNNKEKKKMRKNLSIILNMMIFNTYHPSPVLLKRRKKSESLISSGIHGLDPKHTNPSLFPLLTTTMGISLASSVNSWPQTFASKRFCPQRFWIMLSCSHVTYTSLSSCFESCWHLKIWWNLERTPPIFGGWKISWRWSVIWSIKIQKFLSLRFFRERT